MPYVIGQRCLGEVYAACVAVCPCDCIHPGEHQGQRFMVIDPEHCINCSLCLPECPVDAIFASPDEDPEYARINAELAPSWKGNAPVTPRPANDPPLLPTNVNRFL